MDFLRGFVSVWNLWGRYGFSFGLFLGNRGSCGGGVMYDRKVDSRNF